MMVEVEKLAGNDGTSGCNATYVHKEDSFSMKVDKCGFTSIPDRYAEF
jgi:hypothetical protein